MSVIVAYETEDSFVELVNRGSELFLREGRLIAIGTNYERAFDQFDQGVERLRSSKASPQSSAESSESETI